MAKLLIIDDEIDIREFAKSFFRKRNIEVVTAENGAEALNLLKKETPDLILLDVRMDGMTGIELLRALRAQNNPVKVIMVTGVEEESTIQESQRLGVVGYIHKPLVLEELEQIVMKEIAK